MGTTHVIGVSWINDEHAGSHDVIHPSPEGFDRLRHDRPTPDHLSVGVVGEIGPCFRHGSCSRDVDDIANPDRSRESVRVLVR